MASLTIAQVFTFLYWSTLYGHAVYFGWLLPSFAKISSHCIGGYVFYANRARGMRYARLRCEMVSG